MCESAIVVSACSIVPLGDAAFARTESNALRLIAAARHSRVETGDGASSFRSCAIAYLLLRLEERDRLDAVRRLEPLRLDERREDDFRLGTLAPERRAFDSPMAIACLRLFARFPERPLFSLP
jgi:hypothetical protein